MKKLDRRAVDTLSTNADNLKKIPKDALTVDMVKALPIKVVVADPGWQEIRSNFVGTWKKTPEENLEILDDYLGDMSDLLKVRRVYNYLTGTAFRTGIITHPGISNLLQKIRKIWK